MAGEQGQAQPGSNRVCAIVVTFNRKELLRCCLQALATQTHQVDHILVVNNASTDDTLALLANEFPKVEVLDLSHNVGGAGGFHAGMQWAYDHGFDWLWLMDDDGQPTPDCLERLLAQRGPNTVLVPLQQASDGFLYGIAVWRGYDPPVPIDATWAAGHAPMRGKYLFRFVGPLIPRAAVAQVGLPNKDFFIWFDDHEYALRIMESTAIESVVVPDARFLHEYGGQRREAWFLGRRSMRVQQPPWKTYYAVRNQLYTVTRTRRKPREVVVYALAQLRGLAGDLAYEPDRWQRVWMRGRGVWDGARGRLGKRV